MNKAYIFTIRFVIIVKSIMITGFIVSIISIAYQQLVFQTSIHPEHKDFLIEKQGVAPMMFILTIPLFLSLIVDIREQYKPRLRKSWFILNILVITGYVIIAKLDGTHPIKLLVASVMTILIILAIRKQIRLKNKDIV